MIRANFWERLRISYIQVFEILRDLRKHQQLFIDFICATKVLILIEKLVVRGEKWAVFIDI